MRGLRTLKDEFRGSKRVCEHLRSACRIASGDHRLDFDLPRMGLCKCHSSRNRPSSLKSRTIRHMLTSPDVPEFMVGSGHVLMLGTLQIFVADCAPRGKRCIVPRVVFALSHVARWNLFAASTAHSLAWNRIESDSRQGAVSPSAR